MTDSIEFLMFSKNLEMKLVISDDKRTNISKPQPPPPFPKQKFRPISEEPPSQYHNNLDVRQVFSLSHANAG